MNYLAHAYLSFQQPEILAGNMISDFVKGKQQYQYAKNIQYGIQFHRMIDTYTDQHNATHEASKIFKPVAGRYAGSFVDVVYDHFLATDSSIFSEPQWMSFTKETYNILDQYQALFPPKFAAMFPYMKSQNWLFNYRFKWGVEKSFEGVCRRANYFKDAESVYSTFINQYDILKKISEDFLKEVIPFAQQQLKKF